MTTNAPRYLLDNAAAQAPARLAALTDMFDATTRRHLLDRGVGPGWRCLEVGGGNGSIATWLAERVLPEGDVLVTDLDTRYLDTLSIPNLEVRRHDIVTARLPESTFDLVHVRLVLVHLREWAQVLQQLVAALKPGGWLVAEEFDSDSLPPNPTANPGEVLLETHTGLAKLMTDHGFDRRFGRRLFGRLRAAGLIDVGAEGRVQMLHCESAGVALIRANAQQLRGELINAGYATASQIDRDLARMDESDFMMPSSTLWSAWGRRPAT